MRERWCGSVASTYPAAVKDTAVKTEVNLGGLRMKNPVTVASGTFAAGREYSDFVDVEPGRCYHQGRLP
jgi:dihydroorotate dehydrogenase (NAD+) catalytic subunit